MKHVILILSVLTISFSACKKDSKKSPAEQYVALLKTNQYPDTGAQPNLSIGDIDALLKYANNQQVIENYPRPALSSLYKGRYKLGMIILYTVESIRSQKPFSLFIAATVFDTATPGRTVELAEAAQYYITWWNLNKNKSAEELKTISPLEGTTLSW